MSTGTEENCSDSQGHFLTLGAVNLSAKADSLLRMEIRPEEWVPLPEAHGQ